MLEIKVCWRSSANQADGNKGLFVPTDQDGSMLRWKTHPKTNPVWRACQYLLLRGRPKLRFGQVCKDIKKSFHIDHYSREQIAKDGHVRWNVTRTSDALQKERLRERNEKGRSRKQSSWRRQLFVSLVRPDLRSGADRISHERSCTT